MPSRDQLPPLIRIEPQSKHYYNHELLDKTNQHVAVEFLSDHQQIWIDQIASQVI